MSATFTLTGNLGELLGSTQNRTVFVVTDSQIVDTAGAVIFDGSDSARAVGGRLSITLPANDPTNLPYSSSGPQFGFTITVGNRSWQVPAQAPNSTHDLSEFTIPFSTPITSDATKLDALNAGLLSNPTSSTRLAMDDRYVSSPIVDSNLPARLSDSSLGARYLVKGQTATANEVFVAPGGSDTANTGLTVGSPFKTFQKAFDYLATQGPLLQGFWTVVAAAGTYSGTFDQSLTTRSVNRIVVRGPAVNGGVPTAIISGAGGGDYQHGLRAGGVGVRVEFRDLKFTNFNGDPAGNSRAGCVGDPSADVWFNNVHATNCTWTGVYAFSTVRALVSGGVFDNCRSGIVANDTQCSVTGGTLVKNCGESGVYWSRGTMGHLDDAILEANAIGLRVAENSRVDTVNVNFKRNNYAIRCESGGVFGEGGAPNVFNAGTADAQVQQDLDYKAGAGDTGELQLSTDYMRVAYDRTTRSSTGTTSEVTLTTPYTIKARRLVGAGKQARVVVRGVFGAISANSTVTVYFGGMAVPFATPAAATNVTFEIDVEMLEVPGGYRAIGRITQGANNSRMVTAASGFTNTANQDVKVSATMTSTGDSVTLYRTDVYLMG